MFRGLFFLVLLFSIGASLPAQEQKTVFRALVACDLVSKSIKLGSTADFVRMKRNLSAIASQLGLPLRMTALRKGSLTVPRIKKWISSLPKGSNDIVVFYYSGHGGRAKSSQGRWPFIICPKMGSKGRPKLFMGKTICDQIVKKNPRLSLIMFDSCNNQVREKAPVPLYTALDIDSSMLPQLRGLFLQSRGVVIASAASPGEIAVTAVQGPLSGGIFTTGFLFSLKLFANKPNATWDDVFLGTSLFCRRFYHGRQNPQYSIKTL